MHFSLWQHITLLDQSSHIRHPDDATIEESAVHIFYDLGRIMPASSMIGHLNVCVIYSVLMCNVHNVLWKPSTLIFSCYVNKLL